MEKPPTHGGRREGSGRRPMDPSGEPLKNRAIRLGDADWEKLKLLGMTWLRETIRRAKPPRERGEE